MTNRSKVLAIELREKRIAIVQVGVVRAQARFERLATFAYCFDPSPCRSGVAIVSSQITECLLAFEYGRRSNLLRVWPIAGDVGAVSALWQTHFHRACRKPMCLRPNKSQLFKLCMLCRFATPACYSRNHLARSRNPFDRIGDRQTAAGFRLPREMGRKIPTRISRHNS